MLRSMTNTISGTCDPRFEAVRTQFRANLDNGLDVGASVALVLGGELVVDLWGGTIDDAGTPWAEDTLINVWSTTKTMTALCVLILADQGEIDFDAPVAKYWPEFAANGKGNVLVRHLMSHTAGLPGWDTPLTVDDILDWEKNTSLLAAQATWWEPGTASGYHAVSQGQLLGELVRRVTGQTLGTFFAKEVAGPLGADFHIGTPESADSRVALVIPPSTGLAGVDIDPTSIAGRTFLSTPLTADASWTIPWRRAELPAANGHGNARSVALAQSVLAGRGETRGVRLLSEAGCMKVFEEQCNGTDLVLGMPLRHGIGYGLPLPELPISPNEHACYWGGWGGSLCINDLDANLTFTYVMNRMGEGTTGDLRGGSLLMAAYGGLAG